LVKPDKVLYLAVDGVAPRAKMNQQRSRRFRSAKEAEVTAAEILARDGMVDTSNRFDSNCITPGTDFMLKLSLALQKWVDYKMKTDPFWQTQGANVVIVSGPDVPGEGEHKVMDYIREERFKFERGDESTPYRPGDTHVLYGLDADLIMLGLVTHEASFNLLREKMSVVMAGRGRNKHRKKKDMMEYDANDFEVLELRSLRQLLAIQFRKFAEELQDDYSLERIIDDFVFMCMLVGNDFLSMVPHLEIDNGAISLMMSNYIDLLPTWGGYLTDKEKIHPKRMEQFLYNLAAYEEEHFKRRGLEENEPGWKLSSENEVEEDDFYGHFYGGVPTPPAAVAANRKGAEQPPASSIHPMGVNGEFSSGNRAFRRHHPDSTARSYRDFYYETKLGWQAADREATLFRRRAHVRDYFEGLHWVLNYYHNGCPSWDWYFPHLYSPLCTDMVNLDEFYEENNNNDDEEYKAFHFEQGTPFPSLAQLLSVLPPQSADLLPEPLAELMIHPSSPLMSYYPQDFTVDPNGKRQSWEAIVQIPFIDADVLLETVEQVIHADEKANDENKLFTNAERRRNVRGTSHTFVAPQRTTTGEEEVPNEERVVMEQVPLSRGPKKGTSAKWGRNDQAGSGAGAPRARQSPKGAVEAGAPRRRRSPKGSSKSELE
jgi:5'-3' exoribonuclease 1